jgi:acetylornithine deacetylase/succinyl-diaminopimelate desuccinylase-like protein
MKRTLCVLILCVISAAAQGPSDQLAREVLKELVEIDTSKTTGGHRKAAEMLGARLRAAGFAEEDVQLIGPGEKRNLVVRYRGRSAEKPILLMAHIDVVEALREDWTLEPFHLTEKDGFFYGRGTDDNKAGIAAIVVSLIRWKQEGFTPSRDLWALLTYDEESDAEGIQWLLANLPAVKQAAFALNTDGGGGLIREGKHVALFVQTSEKSYADYEWKATDAGGHSSQPRPADNPIYRLAEALTRLEKYSFPASLNETTQRSFAARAKLEAPQYRPLLASVGTGKLDPGVVKKLSAVPRFNATLRTTCVATQLGGGHAPNALPQMAKANVNCRILPQEDLKALEARLRELAGPNVKMTALQAPVASPVAPLSSDVMQAIEKVTAELFPGAAVIPSMSTGASDGSYLKRVGIPVYGVSALFGEEDENRAHGRDERIRVKEYYNSIEHWDRLVKAVAK